MAIEIVIPGRFIDAMQISMVWANALGAEPIDADSSGCVFWARKQPSRALDSLPQECVGQRLDKVPQSCYVDCENWNKGRGVGRAMGSVA